MRILLCTLAVLTGTCAARSETVTVTNVAGRALTGELVGVTDRTVRLRLAGGTARDLPHGIFKAGEVARLRALLGLAPTPSPAVARLERDRANQLARIDARVAAGTLAPEDAAQKRNEINTWFTPRIAKIRTEETR